MTVNWLATLLLVPPLNLAVIAAIALFFARRRAGRIVLGAALAGLLILSLPIVGDALLRSLEHFPEQHPASPQDAAPGAIVVLGAELRYDEDPEGGPPTMDLGPLSLERTRAAAALHRRTGLPILVSGGVVGDEPAPVGAAMARSLADDFEAPPRWVEIRSRDTWQNARFSAEILQAAGIHTVYVVTHAWHMPRALLAFQRAGLDAVPAPVRIDAWPGPRWQQFVPGASTWQISYFGLHEWVGLAFYAIR